MPREPKQEAGNTIGQFRLLELLGIGGNAEVWRARSSSGELVALKVLSQRNVSSEPYRRFRDEVRLLEKVAGTPGVLPLLSYSLPEQPTKTDPAWLSMPVAERLRDALGEAPELSLVVRAMQGISEVLSQLHQGGIFHRDIKPTNLYRHDGQWCIGDFGLAAFPEKESVTGTAGHIGPIYYLAPELLLERPVEPGPADVYALAKTLWVLASGQSYPLPGNLSRTVEITRLSAFTSHERVGKLEVVLERATNTDPSRRPTMKDLSIELRNWLEGTPATSYSSVDFSAMKRRLRSVVQRHTQADSDRQHRQAYVQSRLEDVKQRLEKNGRVISDATDLTCQYGAWAKFVDGGFWDEVKENPNRDYRHHMALMVQVPVMSNGKSRSVSLMCGVGLMATLDGTLVAMAAHRLHLGDSSIETLWLEQIEVTMESATEEIEIEALCNRLYLSLPMVLSRFDEILSFD